MVSPVNAGSPTAAVFQTGSVGNPQQEPKQNQIQPREAPAADTQNAGNDSREDRGRSVNVKV